MIMMDEMRLNTNEQIAERIRHFGKQKGLVNDNQICRAGGFFNSVITNFITKTKTAPRIDTLQKFADAVGCSITDLIYPASAKSNSRPISASNIKTFDRELFFSILKSTNKALKDGGMTAPEEKKIKFVMALMDGGYGQQKTKVANDNEIARAVQLAWRAAA